VVAVVAEDGSAEGQWDGDRGDSVRSEVGSGGFGGNRVFGMEARCGSKGHIVAVVAAVYLERDFERGFGRHLDGGFGPLFVVEVGNEEGMHSVLGEVEGVAVPSFQRVSWRGIERVFVRTL